MPFLEIDNDKDPDAKELTQPQLEEALARQMFISDHEQFRKDNWETLKHFRSKYDNEFILSDSIMSSADITNRKKE